MSGFGIEFKEIEYTRRERFSRWLKRRPQDLKWWFSTLRYRLPAFWYMVRYGIKAWGMHKTMLPTTGKGKYVDVLVKGSYIDIINHGLGQAGTIRLIPFQPNHGVMVEFLNTEGKIGWRVVASYSEFHNMGKSMGEMGPEKLEPDITVESKKLVDHLI